MADHSKALQVSLSETPARRSRTSLRAGMFVVTACAVVFAGAWALSKMGPNIDSAAPPAVLPESERRVLDQALLKASVAGDANEVARLLRTGASPNARDENGHTALMFATTGGHEVVERLMQDGFAAKVTIEGLPAPAVTDPQLKSIDLLIERGADVGALNRQQETALLLAVARDYASIVARLLEAGASANSSYGSGLPAISLAVKRGFTETLQVLLKAGANVDQPSVSGKLALHYAAETGNLEITRLLLDHRSGVNAGTSSGWTPLHIAASLGYDEIVALLLTRGANKEQLTKRGRSASDVARARGHDELSKRLAVATQ